MAERTRKIKPAPAERQVDDQPELDSAGDTASKLKSELDDLLDDIDEVLEANAEDFVKSYVQKGGE
jgi:ubiquitin-like protein Pup